MRAGRLAALALVLVGACAEGGDAATGSSPTEEATLTQHPDPRVQQAVSDLAERQGVDPSEVSVADAREVTWPNSSLGCPKPGMMYTQVLTEGYLAVLEVDGRRFEYHGRASGPLTLCEHPTPPVSG